MQNVLKVTMLQERALAQEFQLGSPDGYFPCERVGSGDETSMSVTHITLSMRRTQQHTSYLHSGLTASTGTYLSHFKAPDGRAAVHQGNQAYQGRDEHARHLQ